MKTALLLTALGLSFANAGETIRIAIGTQDTTINCAAGGPIVRELNLLEKYLPHDGKYKDVKYEVHWLNLPTGAQLNSEILANRLDIVSMADFPSIVRTRCVPDRKTTASRPSTSHRFLPVCAGRAMPCWFLRRRACKA